MAKRRRSQIQPSEFVKIFLLLALAHLVFRTTNRRRINDFKSDIGIVAKILAVGLPIFFLVLIQPDLGTSMVIASLIATMLLLSGVSWRLLTFLGMLAAAGLTFLVWLHNNYFELFFQKLLSPIS